IANMPPKDSRIQQLLSKLGNELEALKFVTKESWNSIAERFLSKTPQSKEIRIPQSALSEEVRARELFDKDHVLSAAQGHQATSNPDKLSQKTVNTSPYYKREDVLRSLSRSDIES